MAGTWACARGHRMFFAGMPPTASATRTQERPKQVAPGRHYIEGSDTPKVAQAMVLKAVEERAEPGDLQPDTVARARKRGRRPARAPWRPLL